MEPQVVASAVEVVDLTKMYWVVGIVVVTNIGTVGSVLWILGRALWWFSKLDSRVEINTRDIEFAHRKIKNLETSFEQ